MRHKTPHMKMKQTKNKKKDKATPGASSGEKREEPSGNIIAHSPWSKIMPNSIKQKPKLEAEIHFELELKTTEDVQDNMDSIYEATTNLYQDIKANLPRSQMTKRRIQIRQYPTTFHTESADGNSSGKRPRIEQVISVPQVNDSEQEEPNDSIDCLLYTSPSPRD